MKDIIIGVIGLALLSFVITTDFSISLKPFKFAIEQIKWGYAIGLFLIVIGGCIFTAYAKHLGKVESGYYKGYEDGANALIELLKKQKEDETKI